MNYKLQTEKSPNPRLGIGTRLPIWLAKFLLLLSLSIERRQHKRLSKTQEGEGQTWALPSNLANSYTEISSDLQLKKLFVLGFTCEQTCTELSCALGAWQLLDLAAVRRRTWLDLVWSRCCYQVRNRYTCPLLFTMLTLPKLEFSPWATQTQNEKAPFS